MISRLESSLRGSAAYLLPMERGQQVCVILALWGLLFYLISVSVSAPQPIPDSSPLRQLRGNDVAPVASSGCGAQDMTVNLLPTIVVRNLILMYGSH